MIALKVYRHYLLICYEFQAHTPQGGVGFALFCGVTDPEEIKRFPYRPKHVLSGVGDIPALPDD